MNKTCKKCGASVPVDQKFCTSCGGNEFTEAAAVQPTVAPVQPAVAPVAPVAGAQPPKKGMPTWLKVILTLGRRRSLLGLLLFILFILIIALIYFLLEKWIQFQDWLSEKKRKK